MLAFEKLARKEERFHLTMVSNVPEQYRERFGNRPWITMVGANLSKGKLMDEYFARTDVFVLPTYEDCFGMVVLEALSFGLPIITTPVYAIPEMVEHKRNGFIIEAPLLRVCQGWASQISNVESAHGKNREQQFSGCRKTNKRLRFQVTLTPDTLADVERGTKNLRRAISPRCAQ